MTGPATGWRALLPLAALRLGLIGAALLAIRLLVDCPPAAGDGGWCGLVQMLLFGLAVLAVVRLTRGPWQRALGGR